MKNFQEFIDYCLDFYGWNGLYDQGRTREQIAYATLYYLDSCNDKSLGVMVTHSTEKESVTL